MPRFEFFDESGDQGLTVFAPHGVDVVFADDATRAGRPDQTLVTVTEANASRQLPRALVEPLGKFSLADANR